MQPVSIEKETFPELASDRKLYSFELEGFWMDIGQPHDYLSGSRLYLNHLENSSPEILGHPSAQTKKGLIVAGFLIGPFGNNRGWVLYRRLCCNWKKCQNW